METTSLEPTVPPAGYYIQNGSLNYTMYDNDHFQNFGTSPQMETLTNLFEVYIKPVLVVVGAIGNLMILITVRQKNLRNWSICFYLAAYAVGNLLILLPMTGLEWVCKMTGTKYITELGDWSCKLWQFLMCVIVYSGIWLVFAMLVDQCIAIWTPIKAASMCTVFMAKFAVIIIVVGLVVISIHAIWTYELFPHGCYLYHRPHDFLTLVWPWFSLSFYCIIPLILIMIFIIMLICGILSKNSWKKTLSHYHVPADITFLTLALSIMYVLFATPKTTIHIIETNLPNSWLTRDFMRRFEIAQVVSELLVYLNPALAFVVCLTVSTTFRTELRDLFRQSLMCKHITRVYEMRVNSTNSATTQLEYDHCSETTPL